MVMQRPHQDSTGILRLSETEESLGSMPKLVSVEVVIYSGFISGYKTAYPATEKQ